MGLAQLDIYERYTVGCKLMSTFLGIPHPSALLLQFEWASLGAKSSQNGKKNSEELHDLENTIDKYQNIIQSDKKRESLLNETIMNLIGICKDKDSLNNTLKITIDDLLYETEVIRDSIKTYEILNSKLKVESEEHKYTMEDSISRLNDKIIRLKSFIVDNVRPSKQKGLID